MKSIAFAVTCIIFSSFALTEIAAAAEQKPKGLGEKTGEPAGGNGQNNGNRGGSKKTDGTIGK